MTQSIFEPTPSAVGGQDAAAPSSGAAPDEAARALVEEGLAASQANDTATAIRCFEQAGIASPRSGLPHFLLGSEYAALHEFDRAEAAFANAVLLAPGFDIARYQLGLLQFSRGRAASALVTWQPFFALPESEPLPHFVRGFAALAQDQFDEAEAHFGEGLARNHLYPALSNDILKVLKGMGDARKQAPAPESMPQAAPQAWPSVAQPDPPTAPSTAPSTPHHVLVSNYGKESMLH